jgi:hypothetical protein
VPELPPLLKEEEATLLTYINIRNSALRGIDIINNDVFNSATCILQDTHARILTRRRSIFNTHMIDPNIDLYGRPLYPFTFTICLIRSMVSEGNRLDKPDDKAVFATLVEDDVRCQDCLKVIAHARQKALIERGLLENNKD